MGTYDFIYNKFFLTATWKFGYKKSTNTKENLCKECSDVKCEDTMIINNIDNQLDATITAY